MKINWFRRKRREPQAAIEDTVPDVEKTSISWLTTKPNPHRRGYGTDDGTRGWRLHAVPHKPGATLADIGRQRPLCGFRPAWGWCLDLWIEAKCARCLKALRGRECE